jgi:hypothetical protein
MFGKELFRDCSEPPAGAERARASGHRRGAFRLRSARAPRAAWRAGPCRPLRQRSSAQRVAGRARATARSQTRRRRRSAPPSVHPCRAEAGRPSRCRGDVLAVRKEPARSGDPLENGCGSKVLLYGRMKRLLDHPGDHRGGSSVARHVRDQNGARGVDAKNVVAEIAAELVATQAALRARQLGIV